MDQNTGMRLDVHFISDLQQTSMPPGFADLQAGPHTSLNFHCIGKGGAPNWTVETVSAPEHVYDQAHTRDLRAFGGLIRRMPKFVALFTLAGFASLGPAN